MKKMLDAGCWMLGRGEEVRGRVGERVREGLCDIVSLAPSPPHPLTRSPLPSAQHPLRAKLVYGGVLTGSLAWLGLIFAAPWLMAEGYILTSMILYRGLSAVCHQMPERSFYFAGFPVGVCSRCTGIYIGFVIGLLVYPILRNLSNEIFPTRGWLIAASVLSLADFTGGYIGLFPNTFVTRAATGLLFGAVAAFYILPGLVSLFSLRAIEARENVNMA